MDSSKSSLFHKLIKRKKPIIAVGAHNPLSAILIEKAGFDAIWASSFEISASLGVPDADILSTSENLYITKMINDKVSIPVIADCDTGYGNAINVIRIVEEYEKVGIAGICLEDNIFPKKHSFWSKGPRYLESIDEFVGKIKAAKRTQRSKDFSIIARTESFIAGLGLNEALKRAYAYEKAGADMIVVHSKEKMPTEVIEFVTKWKGKTPLVAIPTIYKTASVEQLYKSGYKMIIFANAAIRSAVFGMTNALKRLNKERQLSKVDSLITTLDHIYDLTEVNKMPIKKKNIYPKFLRHDKCGGFHKGAY